MTTVELDKWAAALPDRRVIEDFLQWCSAKRIELCQWYEDSRYPWPCSADARLLDEYHEIDQQRLDKEQRELLEEHRRLTGKKEGNL